MGVSGRCNAVTVIQRCHSGNLVDMTASKIQRKISVVTLTGDIDTAAVHGILLLHLLYNFYQQLIVRRGFHSKHQQHTLFHRHQVQMVRIELERSEGMEFVTGSDFLHADQQRQFLLTGCRDSRQITLIIEEMALQLDAFFCHLCQQTGIVPAAIVILHPHTVGHFFSQGRMDQLLKIELGVALI